MKEAVSMTSKKLLSIEEFILRAQHIDTFDELASLRKDCIDTENEYRKLFSQQRESWYVPEVEDPHLFLLNVFSTEPPKVKEIEKKGLARFFKTKGTVSEETITLKPVVDVFKTLPRFEEDKIPRCMDLEKRRAEGELGIVSSKEDFELCWSSLTEDCLRFMDWTNVIAAGGSVAGCLAPIPKEIQDMKGNGQKRMKLRKYFHDEFLPGSDIDLFLYGINEEDAKKKLVEIYDAVQAASPFPVRCFRSTHAITLVSQYPFRHVQIVLRIYSSPSEVLCGFDVDSCAAAYDGTNVLVPPRSALSIMTQSNIVDMSRRSPSYEMRLAKYATRGFEILVEGLDRERVDPFIFEKRFDEAKGLSRLLLLEKLRTPEERLRYRLEKQMKTKGAQNWRLQNKLRKLERDRWNLNRHEGSEGVPLHNAAEMSDYSTIFLPFGPEYNAEKIERQMKKKDKIMNSIEIKPNGEVTKNKRKYKIHVCAVGTMEEVIANPFPDDPKLPDDLPQESREMLVYGEVSFLVDNPGRQQIGSFNPITNEDWSDGAYFTIEAERLTKSVVIDDVDSIKMILKEQEKEDEEVAKRLLLSKDFLGRTSLHLAALCNSLKACNIILNHDLADAAILQARLPDGRTALHIASMKGNTSITKLILEKRVKLAEKEVGSSDHIDYDALFDVLDIDCSDWENKMNPLHYAIALGQKDIVELLLEYNADAHKVAVHKDKNTSFSALTLLANYATQCGQMGYSNVKSILSSLLDKGCTFLQTDRNSSSAFHHLAMASDWNALSIFLEVAVSKGLSVEDMGLNKIDSERRTPLFLATLMSNSKTIDLLLAHGAKPVFTEDEWSRMEEIINYRSHSYDKDGQIKQRSMLRCPMALSAMIADVECLRSYCSHDKSLSNSAVPMPVPKTTTGYQRNFSSYEYRQSSNAETFSVRIMDILKEKLHNASDQNGNRGKRQNEQYREQVKQAEMKVIEARKMYDSLSVTSTKTASFESFVWSLLLDREESNLQNLKDQSKYYGDIDGEDDIGGSESVAQIESAIKIVEENGGICEVSKVVETKTKDIEIEVGIETNNEDCIVKLYDPSKDFQELSYSSFSSSLWQFTRTKNGNTTACSKGSSEANLRMLDLIATSKIDELRKVIADTKICVQNTLFQTTPLFVSVLYGSFEASELVFKTSIEQYQRHVKKVDAETKQRKEHEEEMNKRLAKLKNDKNPVKSIVGKLNNLDIATGDLAGMVRGPDSLRMDLELKQKPVNEDKISSDIPPEALLLNRSLHPAKFGGIDFVALKKRIEDRFPGTIDENDITKAVYLRPMELAVVKGDISLVKGLIDLVLCIGQGGSMVSENETNSVGEGDASDEEDSYYSEDSDSYYSENSSPSSSTRNIPMTSAQLRFLLVGEGSVNSSIGGLSLLQLATVVDNVDIFKAIANYGQEFTLPRRLIGFWKAKYDIGNKKGGTETELDKLNEKTQKILRIGYSDGIIISPVHFILKVGAQNLFNALITKDFDTVLLDPIYECKFKVPESTTLDERTTLQPYFDAYSWVSTLISEKKLSREELASNICRITTPDEYNRSGLFYAPAEFIPQMLQEGCLNFINSVTRNGVTALMAAAANGEIAKVKALLNAGADRSLSTTDRQWNILHLIIEVLGPEAPTKSSSSYYSSYSNKTKEEEEKDEKERLDKWREVVNVTKTIVDRANSDDLKELFLSPNADHTPLMLAVSKMANEETVSYFLDQTGQQSIDALSRRDKELNSILHLAVKALINADRFDLGVVQSIVKYAEPANTENFHGLNASEISSETVLSIWNDDHLPYKVRNIANTIDINCKVKQQRAQLEQIYSIFKTRAEKRALYNFLVTSEMKERIAVTFEDAKKGSHEATKGVQTSKPDMSPSFQRESTCVKECCFRGP